MVAFRNAGLSVLLVLLLSATGLADDRTAADLLPPTTILYAEIPEPGMVLELFESHPLRQRIEKLQGVRDAYETKQFLQFKAALAIVEAKLGQSWQRVLQSVTEGGIAIGFDAETQGATLLVKARDEEAAPKLLDTIIELARAAAKDAGNSDPVNSGEYRGITAYQIDQAKIATWGRWLAVTNKPESGKAVLDALLDTPENTLATNAQFQDARSKAAGAATAWGYVNVEAIRKGGIAKDVFSGKTDNPVAELLVGGVLDTLQHTPYVTASLTLDQQHTRLEFASPHQQDWTTEAREYFFGPDGNGRAPAPIQVSNQLLALSTYRDLSTMWLRAGDLFKDNIVDQFAQAESVLSTLFSGKDFGEEILGEVHPEFQFVVARQTCEDGTPQPAIKLPAFAAVFRLKDPETVGPEFRRTYQSLIGFLNITGSMNGQPQLDLDIEKEDTFQLVSATYLVEKDASPGGLKINYNFSPAIAFAGEHFVVSSSTALARELARSVGKGSKPSTDLNSTIKLNVSGVSDILADNRPQLVAQNMLSEGHSKEEAERTIGDLLELLAAAESVSIDLGASDGTVRASLEIDYVAD
ncbi:MAG: hypothetical protein O3C40_04270 [Planctomycetota bacterium]|nr:hypothetical protein [Planctomycetota bacterium]